MRMVKRNFPYPTYLNPVAFLSKMLVFIYSRFAWCHYLKDHNVNNHLHANHNILLIEVYNILDYLKFSLSVLILLSFNVVTQECTVMKIVMVVVVVVVLLLL